MRCKRARFFEQLGRVIQKKRVLAGLSEDNYVKPRREGMISQLLGLLVVIAAALEIRHAAQQFAWTFYHGRSVGIMNLVWLFGMGVFAGFLFLTGATVMISGHVMRAVSGVTHRARVWKLAGLFCCLAGLVAILANMGHVVLSHAMPVDQALLFDDMLFHGGFAIAIAGGYVFVLGIMLLMADRLVRSLRLVRAEAALFVQPVVQETSPVVGSAPPRSMTNA
jgi:hypothetical protein